MKRLLPVLVLLFSASAVLAEANWPQWRGPDRTDVSKETGLLKKWSGPGPAQVWVFKNGGIGYAGFAVVKDRLYTMGGRDGKEQLIAIDTAKGEEVWAADLGQVLGNKWGDGPRATPTVDGEFIYALSGKGNLICAEVKSGTVVWKKAMSDFGGSTPGWGYCESVLVDDGKVICTPGGNKGAIIALDKKTGEVVWQCKEFTEGAQYASIIVATHAGKKQYIQLTMTSIVGVEAATGKLLWRSAFPGRIAVIPTPIYRDGHVYVAAGYGAGCKMIKLDDDQKATEVYANKNMGNHHGGVILVGDHLYGYSDGKGWVCQDFKTGDMVWNEKNKLGKGAIACADGMLYLIGESDGRVVLIEASPEGYKEQGNFVLSPQTKLRKSDGRIWTHPVIADGKLYLRDQELIHCYDIKDRTN